MLSNDSTTPKPTDDTVISNITKLDCHRFSLDLLIKNTQSKINDRPCNFFFLQRDKDESQQRTLAKFFKNTGRNSEIYFSLFPRLSIYNCRLMALEHV